MTATESYDLDDRYLADHGTVFLTGIQALARLPLEQLRADRRAGWHTAAFVSGYPGSPLGGYDGAVAAAARLAAGSPHRVSTGAQRGTRGQRGDGDTARRPPARPPLRRRGRHLVRQGTRRRPGRVTPCATPCSPARQHVAARSRSWATTPQPRAPPSRRPRRGRLADMHMPMLYPGDPAEALDLGRHAIALSRTTGLWVALKIVADVADATASVDLHPDRIAPDIPTVDGAPLPPPTRRSSCSRRTPSSWSRRSSRSVTNWPPATHPRIG